MEGALGALSRDQLESRLALADSRLKRERTYRHNVTKVCQEVLGALGELESQVVALRRSVQVAASTLPITLNDAGLMRLFISKFQEELQVSLIQSGEHVQECGRVRRDQRLIVRVGLASRGRATVSTDELSVLDVRFDTLRSMLNDLGVLDAPLLRFRCTATRQSQPARSDLPCPPWVVGGSVVGEFVIHESSSAPMQFVVDSHAVEIALCKGPRQLLHSISVALDVPGVKWSEAMASLGCVDLLPPTAMSPSYTLGSRSHKKPKLGASK